MEALFFIDFLVGNATFAALTGSLFDISAFLLRKKNVGWWVVILTLVPSTIITAFALHAVGWVPKPTGPL